MAPTFNNDMSGGAFFHSTCSLCRQNIDAGDITSFLAVSACQPDPARATWKEVDGLPLLCVGRVAAKKTATFGELPSVHLVHLCCYTVVAIVEKHRTVFDCFRALSPVLRSETPSTPRAWPWTSSCAVYAPILRKVLLEATNTGNPIGEAADLKGLQVKIQSRLHVFAWIKTKLALELSEMILDYLPFELALALDNLSGGAHCLLRLRQDPIAHRFERAIDVLGQRLRLFEHPSNQIKLASEMVADFVFIGGRWYLQDISAATHAHGAQEQAEHTTQIRFQHTKDCTPYVALQIDEFGITHLALKSVASQPQWISPNAIDAQPVVFQDSSTERSFETVTVTSDVSAANRLSNL